MVWRFLSRPRTSSSVPGSRSPVATMDGFVIRDARKVALTRVEVRTENRELRLFLPLPNLHIEADHAILVAQGHDRDVSRYVVFHLNNLLRGHRHIRAVGDRQVACDLLLNRHLRPVDYVSLARQALRIDLDPADSKQTLYPTADCGIERLID